ncbi:MAG: manganese ABC transporter permease [Phycisphaerae bacterium]|nr:MAG: metal ABC transporter permease [Planctomycetia bacterium]RIK71274.1 MAG: iron ABC transporter [Planctomycetota bacterium]GJQ26389.1 MAG: manganese ABC transporter permease [Phycisphaerae bacterium]
MKAAALMPMLAMLTPDDGWVMATAVLCNVACAVLGCFLVLRRMALLGDAISHAVLPGLALAFILTGTRHVVPMLIGALIVGVFTAYATQLLHQWGKVPEDSSMGVVFTSLFALGVLLITFVADSVDLDPGCVLYGDIGAAPGYPLILFGREWPLPRQTAILAGMCAVNLMFVTLCYKELQIVSFDAFLATTMGISATLVHYLLMTLVAATAVASFEAVGSILVVAMLIAPPATAYLLTDRLKTMLVLAAVIGAVSGVIGYLIAAYVIDTPPAAMMATVATAFFALAVFLAPRHGYISKRWRQWTLALRIAREDVLGMVYRWEERAGGRPLTVDVLFDSIGATRTSRSAVRTLLRDRLLEPSQQTLRLTDAGRAAAASLVRAHRLWEAYLNKHFPLPLDHLHEPAGRMEHYVGTELQSRIEQEMPGVADPHGSRIPETP